MTQEAFICSGFFPEEIESLAGELAQKGISLQDRTGSLPETLRECGEPRVVLYAVRAEEELYELKRVMANAPDNFYAAGVPRQADSELFDKLFLVSGLRYFLLPIKGSEIRRLASVLKDSLGEHEAERLVYGGLRDFRVSFEWNTDEVLISRISRWIGSLLRSMGFYTTLEESDRTVLALEEALANAVEHGNLELSSELRPDDLGADDLFSQKKSERLQDARYGKRKLRLGVEIDSDKAAIVIADEGKGFDTSRLRAAPIDANDTETILDNSGKGFYLITRAFDRVTYNDAGTELSLVKVRRQTEREA
jgi:anti-sigma regulatory factor (Ser/Thr protein kinase)